MLFVGFVTNDDLAAALPSEEAEKKKAQGGGYFIAKNSWSCDSGDGGYHYVPVDYVKKYFTRLSVVVIPPERSQLWMTAKASASEAPKVQITQPFVSTDVLLAPHPVYFGKDIDLAAVANDTQDGAGCCGASFTWKLLKRATPDGAWKPEATFNSGAKAHIAPTVLFGAKEARIELTVQDSDKNKGRATLWLADVVPAIRVVSPQPEQTFFTLHPQAFEARVVAENVPDLDCSKLTWTIKSTLAPDEVVTGCKPTPVNMFNFPGDRDVQVDWVDGAHTASATVKVHVVPLPASGPPKVTLALIGEPMKNGDAVMRFTFVDPGGLGQAFLGQYKLAWELEHDGIVHPITPAPTANANEVQIPLHDELKDLCGTVQVSVRLTVTDLETLSGSDTKTFPYPLPPCIN